MMENHHPVSEPLATCSLGLFSPIRPGHYCAWQQAWWWQQISGRVFTMASPMQTQTPLLESAGLTSDFWLSFFSLILKKVEMFLVLESGKSMTLLNSYICRPFLRLETYENINCPKQAQILWEGWLKCILSPARVELVKYPFLGLHILKYKTQWKEMVIGNSW